MRLLLWGTLACTCAVSGDLVLALITAALTVVCADDRPISSRTTAARRRDHLGS